MSVTARTDNFFSEVVAKPTGEISRPKMVEALLSYNDQNGDSVRLADSSWIAHIASTLPFSKVIALQLKYGNCDPLLLANHFLREAFTHLDLFGVSYDVSLNPDDAGKKKIDELVNASKKAGLSGQATNFVKEFARLRGLRRIFAMMHNNGLLTGPDFVIPTEHLAETFLAEPVWFTSAMKIDESARLQQFGSLFQKTEQSDLYKLYNYGSLTFADFDGLGEPVPMNIMEVMSESLKFFDHLVIMTPYHDLADQTWKSSVISPRSIDPEVFGVMEGKPFLIRLGRWSGTGFLPSKCDQIATTVMHLLKNREAINDFLVDIFYAPWYEGVWDKQRHDLYSFLGRLHKATAEVAEYFSPPSTQEKQRTEKKGGILNFFAKRL